jgi:ribonuclease-3
MSPEESIRNNEREQSLQKYINYKFTDPTIITRALTWRSYAEEHKMPNKCHMNGLATLGDSIINLLVIQSIIKSGEIDKGKITSSKITRVKNSRLKKIAEKHDLQHFIYWDDGAINQKIWENSNKVLATCIESIIGAVFLDSERLEIADKIFQFFELVK